MKLQPYQTCPIRFKQEFQNPVVYFEFVDADTNDKYRFMVNKNMTLVVYKNSKIFSDDNPPLRITELNYDIDMKLEILSINDLFVSLVYAISVLFGAKLSRYFHIYEAYKKAIEDPNYNADPLTDKNSIFTEDFICKLEDEMVEAYKKYFRFNDVTKDLENIFAKFSTHNGIWD